MCPRLGGSAFSRKSKRDVGVSSKAHKFACELRALLASDKHLGSAERSERQLRNSTRQQVPEALWRIPVRLRESRRAALVALVGGGWEHECSRVSHMHIIPAQGILSFLISEKPSSRQGEINVFAGGLVG